MRAPGSLMRIERVTWLDSHGVAGGPWHAKDDIDHEAIEITSVGFLLNEGDTAITLAAHVAPNQISGEMIIPKCAILKRKKLTVFRG